MNDMCALSDIQDLTPVQRLAHLAYWYMSEVENGGHQQYFLNKVDFEHDEVAQALVAPRIADSGPALSRSAAHTSFNPMAWVGWSLTGFTI